MKLVIGGYAQGKLNYVMQKNSIEERWIWHGLLPDKEQQKDFIVQKQTIVIDQFHRWVRERMLQGGNPEEEILDFLKENLECIIISDEIGNGIVPADAFERECRERTGRILVTLADRADEVVRVICGIGQKIK